MHVACQLATDMQFDIRSRVVFSIDSPKHFHI